MATQTDHMKLTKPAYTDSADIAVINSNMDAIDTATSKILPVISGTTNNSGYTIASGEYFEANGKLYKANASIPTNQAWSSSATEQSDNGAINALNAKITDINYKLFKGNSTAIANVDCNTAEEGTIFVSTGAVNGPGVTWFNLITIIYDSGSRIQSAITTSNRHFVRTFDGTSWRSWQEIALKSDVDVQNYTSQATDSNGHQFLKIYKIGNLKIINARTGATTVAAGDTLLTLPNEMAANYEVFVPTSSSNGSINGQVSLANKTVKMNSLSGNGGNYFAYTLVYY